MIATTSISASQHAPSCLAGQDGGATVGSAYWLDPGTAAIYPVSYPAYRQAREAEEKPLPRHRTLGHDIDHYVWRRGLDPASDAEVCLTVRPDAPVRIRRMVAEVLRSIRRGQPAGDAIRHVSRRFGLAQPRARAFFSACIEFEVRPGSDALGSSCGVQQSSPSVMGRGA